MKYKNNLKMYKEIYNIINNIFCKDEIFEVFKKNKDWVYIYCNKNRFVNIYINNNDNFIIIFSYKNNNLEHVDKYKLNKNNKYYKYINIRNKLELLYEKKMIKEGITDNHLGFFNKIFLINM